MRDRRASDDYGLIDTLARLYDEPFADSSAIPTYRVCQLARKRVTVALSGDGGDENFAGYRRYRYAMAEERVRSMLPLALRKPVFGPLGAAVSEGRLGAAHVPRQDHLRSAGARPGRRLLPRRRRSCRTACATQLFSDSFRSRAAGLPRDRSDARPRRNAPTDDPLSLIQYLDLKTYLPGDILTKVDRASMAHSLEVRVPLLDHELIEWVSGLPSSIKLRGGEGKYIFKKALEPHLPNDILYRNKMGFSMPLARWLRGPLRSAVRDARARASAARHRHLQSGTTCSHMVERAPVRRQRLQRAAVVGADVRSVPARQRRLVTPKSWGQVPTFAKTGVRSRH